MSSNRKVVLRCAVVLIACSTVWNGIRTTTIPPDTLEQNNARYNRTQTQSIPIISSQRTESMAACLLIKDDNHLLIEWIAYHYLTLPLRYLVIAVDPESLTSPLPIINRWNNATNVDIEIVLWNDEDYMNQTLLATRLNLKLSALQLKNTEKKQALVDLHLSRQRRFISQCFLYHQSKNRTWVAHVDTDEFILFNYIHSDEREVHNISESDYHPDSLREQLPPIGTQTVADFLKDVQNETDWGQKGCIGMPRLKFGSLDQEEYPDYPVSGLEIAGIDQKTLLTMRQFRHSQATHPSVLQKVILDVSKMGKDLLHRGATFHRPSRACPQLALRPDFYPRSFLRIHHYLGSWEQFSARADVRRNRAEFDRMSAFTRYGPNYDIVPWLQEFVRLVGTDTAQHLLKGGGIIEGNNYVTASIAQPSCALLFYGDIVRIEETALQLLRENILDANPSCDVFLHSYTMAEAVENGVDEASQNSSLAKVNIFKVHQSSGLTSYEERLETVKEFQRKRYDAYRYFRRVFPNSSVSMDNVIRQLHSVESVWRLMESHEKRNTKRFNRVGLFGFDVHCTHPIHITTDETAVIIACSGQEKTINGQAFYGFRDVAEICALDPFRSAEDYLLWRMTTPEEAESSEWSHEAFLKYLLVEKWSVDVTMKNAC